MCYNGLDWGARGRRPMMKRVKGRYDGSAVVLQEKVDIAADTEVEVLIPKPRERSLTALLDELGRRPVDEVMPLDEVVALVHEVRGAGGRQEEPS